MQNKTIISIIAIAIITTIVIIGILAGAAAGFQRWFTS
ncbi:hypothetical protein LCGC14_1623800 [marine sediment metagenome]|uniref:Uncharacterized protein n=1 Tax=marine sediment metagenome TaxID=412755 RepID=A0A0F9IRS6_9ZZZZ